MVYHRKIKVMRYSKYFRRCLFKALLCGAGVSTVTCLSAQEKMTRLSVVGVSTTAENPWRNITQLESAVASTSESPVLRIWPDKTFQTMDGFGGCFNELGWEALLKTNAEGRKEILTALFSEEGSAFNLARIPIGASDFALSSYSLAETPGDLELKSFSLERDKKHLIPYIRAAQAIRPDLRSWASPWSPPAWMKTNNHYAEGSIKGEPSNLESYANYLATWVESYKKMGIPIYALSPQNEPNISSKYPSCVWTPDQLREFFGEYLGPVFQKRNVGVELWLGLNGDPPNQGSNPNARLITVMEDPKASPFIKGIAFQYDKETQIKTAYELYPDRRLLQSETSCNGGENSWKDAERLFWLMKTYIENGAGSYFAWNMVLNETGMSTWNWKQNALITVDQHSGKITYNGEYYVMRHFSHYVKPGAKRIYDTGSWRDRITFINPDGSIVLIVSNPSNRNSFLSVQVGDKVFKTSMEAHSINTYLIKR